jgi:hypothetical protein
MRAWILSGVLAASLLAVAPGARALATLNIDPISGLLLGATGVEVLGEIYEIEFVEGTCIALFDGCDDAGDFPFMTEADVLEAAQALLDQVWFDGPLGNYDSLPNATAGCTSSVSCTVFIPYALAALSTEVSIGQAKNLSTSTGDDVDTDVTARSFDTGSGSNFTYVRWSVVPEPALLALLGPLLAPLLLRRRRQAGVEPQIGAP